MKNTYPHVCARKLWRCYGRGAAAFSPSLLLRTPSHLPDSHAAGHGTFPHTAPLDTTVTKHTEQGGDTAYVAQRWFDGAFLTSPYMRRMLDGRLGWCYQRPLCSLHYAGPPLPASILPLLRAHIPPLPFFSGMGHHHRLCANVHLLPHTAPDGCWTVGLALPGVRTPVKRHAGCFCCGHYHKPPLHQHANMTVQTRFFRGIFFSPICAHFCMPCLPAPRSMDGLAFRCGCWRPAHYRAPGGLPCGGSAACCCRHNDDRRTDGRVPARACRTPPAQPHHLPCIGGRPLPGVRMQRRCGIILRRFRWHSSVRVTNLGGHTQNITTLLWLWLDGSSSPLLFIATPGVPTQGGRRPLPNYGL